MSAHTPGPWTAERKESAAAWAIRIPGVWIGEVASWCGESKEKQDEATANARLIAASPDLLAAAQNTLDYYAKTAPDRTCLADERNPCGGVAHWGVGAGCPLCSAREAIAKAVQP